MQTLVTKEKEIETLPASILTKQQYKSEGPLPIDGYGLGAAIWAHLRYDDECNNGHNSFSITGSVRVPRQRDIAAGGCIHEEIAAAFPALAPLIKWHLCSSDGPMHYLGNVLYLAGDRDYNGLLKGEFRQHHSRGNQNGGVAGVPNWVLQIPERTERDVYANEKPAVIVCEWKPYGIIGDGKDRELDAARRAAIWPEATDEQLCLPKEELSALLLARLPALMAEFKTAMEGLGFTY